MGGPKIDQNRDEERGGGPRIIILTLTGIHCVLMIPCQNLAGGLQMKHKLTKIGNLPYFGQFGAPPSLMSPVMVNISPPAIIKPCYGQFIINWWLWHHYSAPFTVYSPCYAQFMIN